MNVLHPNDKQNLTKHRKMIRRGTPHPRQDMPDTTLAFRATGKIINRGTIEDPKYTPEIRCLGTVSRNNAWVRG